MISPDLDCLLRTSLARPMTSRQRTRLDDAVAARLSRPSVRPRWAIALLVLVMLVAASMGIALSAAMRPTEAPNGIESASAFQAEIDAAKAEVPIPAGYEWPESLKAADPEGLYSTGGGRSQVEFSAVCAWSTFWLAAEAAGSTADRAAATAVLTDVPSWGVYTGEFSSRSLRAVLDTLVGAVKDADRAPVVAFVMANCGP